jgi:hypothetical protein
MARRLIGVVSSVLLAGTLVVSASTAFADPRDFTLENDSASVVTQVYVSAENDNAWGDDVLGKDILVPGDQVDITFDGAGGTTCYYDLLVVTRDGTQTRKDGENLCTTTLERYTEK